MSYIKAFSFSMIAFIGLNVIFFLIGFIVLGVLDLFFEGLVTTPTSIFAMFLGPIISIPSYTVLWLGYPFTIISQLSGYITGAIPVNGFLIMIIGYIVSPVIAVVIAGKFGENKKNSFLGWFTTAMICAIVNLIVAVVELTIDGAPLDSITLQIIFSIGLGIIYAFLYGSISFLVAD
ncbi:MAG: hypothetical protein ACFFEN_01710 [Candidatus Thorarchaeota archaeon]